MAGAALCCVAFASSIVMAGVAFGEVATVLFSRIAVSLLHIKRPGGGTESFFVLSQKLDAVSILNANGKS